MFSNVLEDIQTEFRDNWTASEIQYGHQEFTPTGNEWILIDVLPSVTSFVGYTTNLNERHTLYVICYARNQVQASKLADLVTTFLRSRDMPAYFIGACNPLHQGPITNSPTDTGSYYVKTEFAFDSVCTKP